MIPISQIQYCPNPECGKYPGPMTPWAAQVVALGQVVAFCPFCGTALESRDEIMTVNVTTERGVSLCVNVEDFVATVTNRVNMAVVSKSQEGPNEWPLDAESGPYSVTS